MSYSPPTTVGSLRRQASLRADESLIISDLSHLAYQMGLQDTAFEYRGEFFELKNSPRSPGLTKAFKIVRYGLSTVAKESLRNLADPDFRKGYVFLPIDEFEKITKPVYSAAHQRTERWFLGKPLMSDVEHVLTDRRARSSIIQASIPVDTRLFARRESGILCAVDLAGYGTALKYASQNMRSFSEEPNAIQETFRKSVAAHFDTMLAKLGAMQIQLAGDGFIAAFPDRVFVDVAEALTELLGEWTELVSRIETLNSAISDHAFRVGSRMALHYGTYEYGRIGGARSFTAAFDGAAVIEVARFEQGLAAAMKSESELAVGTEKAKLAPRGHYVVISKRVEEAMRGTSPVDIHGLSHVGELSLTAKEFEGRADVWVVGHGE